MRVTTETPGALRLAVCPRLAVRSRAGRSRAVPIPGSGSVYELLTDLEAVLDTLTQPTAEPRVEPAGMNDRERERR